MLVPVLLFLLGFVLLIKGGDWFVDAASSIAHRFHMPELLIGATVVSIGTTLPEVMVSAQGALVGSGSIAFGNAIGSVICNTALIAAITLVVRPASVDRKTLVLPSAAFFIAAAFYCFNAYVFGRFSRLSGVVLLAMFVLYMVLTVRQMKNAPSGQEEAEEAPTTSLAHDIVMLVVGAAVIAVGANLLVENAQIIATALGVPESVIALTLVALGTSLPELVTAITSLIKGCSALSLGNIIGANLFNLVLVSGTATVICPFDLSGASATSLSVDIPLMLGVMLVLTIPALVREKLHRWQGIVLLSAYAAYCVFLFCFA
ncbi:MAG: calcium/sodium antiporter [Candidatus Ventricola sp.]|nr:calcium/sodium antiporter [Candidatus Ventricola sp.]